MDITAIEIVKYLILGIVQGFTEPLPISSSGHVAIFAKLLHVDMEGNQFLSFAAFINFGSMLAIIIFFWKKIEKLFWGGIDYIKSGFKENTRESKYLWRIFFSTIPLVIATIFIVIFNVEFSDKLIYVGIALLFTSILLYLVSNKNGKTSIYQMSIIGAIVVGIGQVFALLPGISRSGTTMSVLLLLGFRKKESFDYSFMMFIPASIGALFYSLFEIFKNGISNPIMIIVYLLALFLSFVFTIIGLKLVEKMVIASKLIYFSIYCFCMSMLIILTYLVQY